VKIKKKVALKDQWELFSYTIIPVIYLIKLTRITFLGFSVQPPFSVKITLLKVYNVVIIAEFRWRISSFMTLTWFRFIDNDYSVVGVQYFKPLSLFSFFEASEVESWLIFPL